MTARMAVFYGSGKPIEISECAIPELKEGETLVDVSCCALCRSDLHTVEGRRVEPTPTILGHEVVGRVVKSRANVAPGIRVTWSIYAHCGQCFFCNHELPQKCEQLFKYGHRMLTEDAPLSGGLASHILLRNGTELVSIPDALPDEIAVLANCSTSTAFAAVRQSQLSPGSIVAILGMGILGLTTSSILTAQGHTVIAFDPRESQKAVAAQFGCQSCFFEVGDFKEALDEATNNRGADACIELSGTHSAVELSMRCVRTGGTVVWVGAAAPVGSVSMEPEQVLRRQLTIRGVHNYIPTDLSQSVEFLARNSNQFPFDSLVTASYSLDDLNQAFAAAGTTVGRILIHP